jgi:hypothetical protein
MSTQAEQLQALLKRVQDNRQKPRVATVAATRAPSIEARPPAVSVPSPPQARAIATPPPPMAPEPRAKPKSATPLELAVEGQIASPVTAPLHTQTAAGIAPPPAASARPIEQPTLLVDSEPVQSQKPITNVVSKHPPRSSLTFGELLRRSLSLRPR